MNTFPLKVFILLPFKWYLSRFGTSNIFLAKNLIMAVK